mmetsp:Transcript_44400/g.116661  ORF Transcript_44400/g.116661 Transcript_44400/m.116661 type:complete len:202 (-) Transcript_44400:174-779(-)
MAARTIHLLAAIASADARMPNLFRAPTPRPASLHMSAAVVRSSEEVRMTKGPVSFRMPTPSMPVVSYTTLAGAIAATVMILQPYTEWGWGSLSPACLSACRSRQCSASGSWAALASPIPWAAPSPAIRCSRTSLRKPQSLLECQCHACLKSTPTSRMPSRRRASAEATPRLPSRQAFARSFRQMSSRRCSRTRWAIYVTAT